jgi:uncharacterized SAM-binding protein YcdF (DUF218 family)
MAHGVPKDKILKESRATNTGENILFTKALVAENDLALKTVILVQKPYMERRTYAAFRKLWPEVVCVVASPNLSFEEYPSAHHHTDYWLETMVGDLQRIKEYPKRGWQIEQEIPRDVWEAYEHLVTLGYTKYVMPD